ncbi:MAG: hypothetical protein HXX09_15630 [Bacteroidetes bacterium]|nr:hypothetical protein [Bacteroidota bacterium]
MKKILGLDLGTNSIGWALINEDFEKKEGKIIGLGSRIIPMSQDIMDKFGSGGQTETPAASRTNARSIRKLYQRDNLRRERLHRVLNILNFLPEHYKNEIDFISHKGQFTNHAEPKLPYFKNQEGKFEFLFNESFNKMVEEFRQSKPELFYFKQNGKETKIPFDWTIYYLRKKALEQKISKEELAWVILNFNQKRGYYQLSEENEINEDKIQTYEVLKVKDVIDTGETIKGKNDKLHDVFFENGWKYDRQVVKIEDWIGKTKEYIVTESVTKNGEIKRTFKAVNSELDWIAIKQKTEQFIEKSGKSVGQFIYDTLLENPKQKINGKLVRTIERKFYKAELKSILEKQIKEHPELENAEFYKACILELYPNNEGHRRNIENRDFAHLFLNDIIYYQRPLKSKVSLISDCSLEYRIRKDTGEKVYVKCIAKSNPIFQEFRLWQFISNLKIYEKEKLVNNKTEYDVNVTEQYLSDEEKWIELFDWLNDKEDITQKQFLSFYKLKEEKYRWNYVEDKNYPCNETRAKFINRVKKIEGLTVDFLSSEIVQHLWHLLYSVTDPEERKSAISKFAIKHELSEDFIKSFEKFPPYKKEYGSFSEKAIKKLLPLMRFGRYWKHDNIDSKTKERIDKILTGEFDEKIKNRVREKAIHLQRTEDFKALPLWLASYIIYDRHSEANDIKHWNSPNDIADFLNPNLKGSFKQHSLRNPIVEQILTETLRVVKDIWEEFGNGENNFFDEIHIELGREMKNDSKTRKRISDKVIENENTNQRIKELLKELMQDGIDVRPYSPSHQEILKIYEDGIYQNENKKEELEIIDKIRKNNTPSKSDIQRYKLWLEQGYISPYTCKMIMLSELFSPKYQIEHIFPQARYFDDSMNNKVICEAEVNQLKDNRTAYEFITEFGGSKVSIGGKDLTILSIDDYEAHIKSYFGKNKIKRENLLSADIPESFINRQMNDSRYISKTVKNLLSNIVREENEEEVTSKKVITITGAITSQMKQDWGLNDVWNDIITPRFERMNELTKSNNFGGINPNTNKFLPKVPDEIAKGFNKKRIDHRHHALDALVIAFTTRNHINYLNNLNAKNENDKTIKFELRNTLLYKSKTDNNGNYKWQFYKPWENFTQDTRKQLETTLISFKQNNRVINKTKNKFQKWVADENGVLKKKIVPQTKGDNWAIRKSLHKATVFGKVELIRNGKNYYADAGRIILSEKFSRKQLDSITDTGIQKILENHLKNYTDDKGIEQFDLAFNADGIENLNNNIRILNNGKSHQPIYKVRVSEVGSKFNVGNNGTKNKKYVEADKGTNLFFAIYWNEKKQKREFETIPLNIIIEHQKQDACLPKDERTPVPINKEKGTFLFTLSPNDLVYIPTIDERENPQIVDFDKLSKEQINRIYKCVSFSGSQCFFVRNDIATTIKNKEEFSALNKTEKSIELNKEIMIKEFCWKLNADRLGKIRKVMK